MATIDIKFEWTRGRVYECAGGVIRQIGKGKDRVPFERSSSLYLKFAELDGSPAACVDFAHAWGLLTTPAHAGAEEPTAFWQREIAKAKSQISMLGVVRTVHSRRVRMNLTTFDVALESGEPNARPGLVLQPRTLLSAMLLQLAQSQASGASLQTCEQCSRWFEVGADAKRNVSKFCSDRCRNRYHYERRVIK